MAISSKRQNTQNRFIKYFDEYLKENEIIGKGVRMINSVISDIEALDPEVTLKDKDVMHKKSGLKNESGEEIFRALSKDRDQMKTVCADLLRIIESETKAISEFLGKIPHDSISMIRFSFETIKKFNEDKMKAIRGLGGVIPSFAENLKSVVELPLVTIKESAERFDEFINGLVNVIKNEKTTPGIMFESVGIMLPFLYELVGNARTLTQYDKGVFLSALTGKNFSKNVAEKCLENMSVAFNLNDELRSLLHSNSINLAHNNTPTGDSYNSISDKNKKIKLDKFAKKTLLYLFANESSIVDRIENIYKDIKKDSEEGNLDDKEKKEIKEKLKTEFNKFKLKVNVIESDGSISAQDKATLSNFLAYVSGSEKVKFKDGKCENSTFKKLLKAYNIDIGQTEIKQKVEHIARLINELKENLNDSNKVIELKTFLQEIFGI